MGFSALLQSGICFGALGGSEQFTSTGSPLFGTELTCRKLPSRHQARAFALKIDSKLAVRNEFSGGERREEEQRSKLLGLASASIGFNAVLLMSVTKPMVSQALPMSHKDSPSSWLSLPILAVWGAILLNAFVQYRVLERLTCVPQRRESTGRVDKQRVAELEENVREFVTTARGLSKQVEKLGLRFRVTRRTLTDPIQESAALAQKTSEVVTVLAQREEKLEEQLRGLQRALLAMQEHQVKQLALISLALKRTQKEKQALEPKNLKKMQSSVNVSGLVPKSASGNSSRGISESGDHAPVGVAGDSKHNSINGASQPNGLQPKSTFSAEGSLSRIDFWKDPISSPVAPSGAGPEKAKMGNFFNGRKRTVPSPDSQPESSPNGDSLASNSELEILPENDPSYVEQPDYDSDSWLR